MSISLGDRVAATSQEWNTESHSYQSVTIEGVVVATTKHSIIGTAKYAYRVRYLVDGKLMGGGYYNEDDLVVLEPGYMVIAEEVIEAAPVKKPVMVKKEAASGYEDFSVADIEKKPTVPVQQAPAVNVQIGMFEEF